MDKSQELSSEGLRKRKEKYARVIQLLYARQGLSGKLQVINRGSRHLSYDIRLNNPIQLNSALKLYEPLALSCGVRAVMAQRIDGMVNYQIELPEMYWQYFTREDLPNCHSVGLAEQKKTVDFELDPPHSLIAGASQTSGKTTTVKSILVSLMSLYKPEELGIVLCDFHGDYNDFQNEIHLIRFEFGSSAKTIFEISKALNWANQELSRRIANNLRDERKLVVIIDEAEAILEIEENRIIAQNISKQAAKFGVHLMIATQKPSQKDLPKIIDNCLNKFVGQLSDPRMSANITGHSGLQAHKLTGRGDFLHIVGPYVTRFQVAQATQCDFDKLDRVDIQPVDFVRKDIVDLPMSLPDNSPGRPKVQLNSAYLAWYFYHNPEKISRKMAQDLLCISQRTHELHQSFCREFIEEFLKLKEKRVLL